MELNYFIGLIGLLIASIYDLKSREIEDYIWIFMAIFGFVYAGYLCVINETFVYIIQSVIGFATCFFLGFFMFLLGVGGGDGKLLMGLGSLIPKYHMPVYSPLGMILNYYLIPSFPIMVVINAMFLSIILPLVIFLKNVFRGVIPKNKKEFFCMFVGEKIKISEIKKDQLVLGTSKDIRFTPSAEKEYDLTNFNKDEKVWVTPTIPFAVPMLISYLITPIIGDKIIYLFVSLIGL